MQCINVCLLLMSSFHVVEKTKSGMVYSTLVVFNVIFTVVCCRGVVVGNPTTHSVHGSHTCVYLVTPHAL